MLPPQVITALFTATIVGITARFVNLPAHPWILVVMYLYIMAYRIKQVLDDLVYYDLMKGQAVRRGDPVVAFLSWTLWLIAGITLGDPALFFGLMALVALFGLAWIEIAKRNVAQTPGDIRPEVVAEASDGDKKAIADAHLRWWRLDWIPLLVGGVFWAIDFFGYMQLRQQQFDSASWLWAGPFLMVLFLGVDLITDFKFMFKLWDRTPAKS